MQQSSGQVPALLDGPGADVSDARELLLGYLKWYHEALTRKISGLSDGQLRTVRRAAGLVAARIDSAPRPRYVRAHPLSAGCASLAAVELTQATVDDLLAQLGPADGYMYLPSDLDPQALADLLAHRYGTPRTLFLDGFTDPTVDDSSGVALLVPSDDRAVKIRAWHTEISGSAQVRLETPKGSSDRS
ncbi:hypothetical protein ACF1GY_37695 [Streptomyces sp. NPDC014684]|uniref:hypothetical protein n=1 Tax=Streptomyces sp. NPDC014684 TaxID=3364880 RepID=UPI0036F55BC9